jgi:hypothetical protein
MTKDQCIDANSKAQDLRRDGKVSAAPGATSRVFQPFLSRGRQR